MYILYSDLRSFLVRISHSVKINYYCKLLGINQANVSKFIRGYDHAVDINKLLLLRDYIIEDLNEIIA